MPNIYIDRCYCFICPFSDLKEVAEDHGATTIPELQNLMQFGEQCKVCHPYVRRMLKTGEVVFREIVTENAGA